MVADLALGWAIGRGFEEGDGLGGPSAAMLEAMRDDDDDENNLRVVDLARESPDPMMSLIRVDKVDLILKTPTIATLITVCSRRSGR